MSELPPGGSTTNRLLAAASPEILAAVMSAVVLTVAALVFLRPPGNAVLPPAGSGSPSAVGTIRPTTTPPAATSSSSATPSSPAWASIARSLVDADVRLIVARDRLADLVGSQTVQTSDIARELRSINPTLSLTVDLVAGLDDAGAPPLLVADLRTAHGDALDASLATLQASLSNPAAYEAGARKVVAALADLEALGASLSDAALPGSAGAP